MSTTPALPSYSSGTSTVPLLGDTIGANLDRTAARVGDHEALVECATGRRFSYPQFVAEVDAVALGLDALGVGKGDRVGIWAPNCAEWAFVQFATAKLGAILVNINPAYRTHELGYVLQQAGRRGAWRLPRPARGPLPRRPRVAAAAGDRPGR
jgi:fatty-acyl-CoA synthase